jgi:folate-binding protein YgfZ
MSAAFEPMLLPGRGVVEVTGADALAFLDRLVTADIADLAIGAAAFTGLLTPQGKIQFEFFALRTAEGLRLDTRADDVAALVKRLTMYKLRTPVAIADVSARWRVMVAPPGGSRSAGHWFDDPRAASLGARAIVSAVDAPGTSHPGAVAAYEAHRIACGIPDGGIDYAIGDTYPHEALYDRVGAVSFTKGCFVGQEVVARMQHKTVVRKRVVSVTGAAPLVRGVSVRVGDAEIGIIGSATGSQGLAMLRLDRALEADKAGHALLADHVPLTVDRASLDAFAQAVATAPKAPDL